MGIEIIDGGLFTTVQDFGRIGFQHMGFSVCGAMDKKSLAIGNMLVNNKEDEAGLEMTLVGATIKFKKGNFIAITGANFNPKINNKEVPLYKPVFVKENDILSFENALCGARCYVSFAGGLEIEKVMGSKSTNTKCEIGGYKGRTLKKGDFIKFTKATDYLPNFLSRKVEFKEKTTSEIVLRVILGPQQDAFTEKGINTFFSKPYKITKDFDRMGCRLEGEKIEHKTSADIISDGIALGSIQVPSHGNPIIMMTDRQTTGGYTKIGTVISSDINKLAQCNMGNVIRFKEISLKDAQNLYRKEKKDMLKLNKKINKPCVEVLNPRSTSKKIEKLLIK